VKNHLKNKEEEEMTMKWSEALRNWAAADIHQVGVTGTLDRFERSATLYEDMGYHGMKAPHRC
jgi:hypothetical protein